MQQHLTASGLFFSFLLFKWGLTEGRGRGSCAKKLSLDSAANGVNLGTWALKHSFLPGVQSTVVHISFHFFMKLLVPSPKLTLKLQHAYCFFKHRSQY